MDAERCWILKRVVLVTALSICASLLITVGIYYLATGSIADMDRLGLLIASLAPAIIAPIGSWSYISLSHRLQLANNKLRVLSEVDSLTSTLNRRTFMDVAEKHLNLAARHGFPTSLMVLDFDHFKQVNDQHGHAMGDKVLVQTIDVIQQAIRETDVIARIGGEEFILLLPHTAREGAILLAQRILEVVRQNQIGALEQSHGNQPLKDGLSVTISIGGATCATSSTNLDEMMSRADKLLYDAKQAGRDCYMIEAIPAQDTPHLSEVS
jgi:diguanylate cyclase (GGDEF)-like protein